MFKEFKGRELQPRDIMIRELLRNFAGLKPFDKLEISSSIAELKTKKEFTDLIEAGSTELARDLLFNIANSMIKKRLELRKSELGKIKEKGPAPAPDRTRFRDDELVEKLMGVLEEKFDVSEKERSVQIQKLRTWQPKSTEGMSHGKRGRDTPHTVLRKNMRGGKKISELPVNPSVLHAIDDAEDAEIQKRIAGGEQESET